MHRVAVPLLAVVLPLTAVAQRITITPTVGAFAPLRDQSRWSWTDCCIAGGDFTETLRTELSTATALGLKVEMGWGGSLGLEASVSTASTQRRFEWSASAVPNPPPPDRLTAAARTTMAALRIKFRKRVGRNADVSVGVGPSLVDQAPQGFCGGEPPCIQNLTTVGPSVDVALGFTATRRARIEIGIVNNVYSVAYPEPPFPGRQVDPERSRFWQHDVIISVGFGFVL